eukprot:gene34234-45916_t
MPRLPAAYAPFAPVLERLSEPLQLLLHGQLLQFETLVRNVDAPEFAPQGEFEGLGGLTMRGDIAQLVQSELLLRTEAPLEFLRRIADSETLYLEKQYADPGARPVFRVMISVGPAILGHGRLLALAALLFMARVALSRGAAFHWCFLPRNEGAVWFDEVSVNTIKRFLRAAARCEMTGEDVAADRRNRPGAAAGRTPAAAEAAQSRNPDRRTSAPGAGCHHREAGRRIIGRGEIAQPAPRVVGMRAARVAPQIRPVGRRRVDVAGAAPGDRLAARGDDGAHEVRVGGGLVAEPGGQRGMDGEVAGIAEGERQQPERFVLLDTAMQVGREVSDREMATRVAAVGRRRNGRRVRGPHRRSGTGIGKQHRVGAKSGGTDRIVVTGKADRAQKADRGTIVRRQEALRQPQRRRARSRDGPGIVGRSEIAERQSGIIVGRADQA